MKFDSIIYTQKVIDAIQSVEHVTDVYVDTKANQGVYIAQYDDNDRLGAETKIERKCYTASGYVRQSSGEGDEEGLESFRDAIVLKLEDEMEDDGQ